MVRSSRVDQPPVSGVPVAGATTSVTTKHSQHEALSSRALAVGKWLGGGRTSRIQGVDIDAQIDGLLGPDAFSDLLDDAMSADGVDGAGLDNLEAAVAVVFVVGGAGEGGADAGVDVAVVGEETFLAGVVEVRAVVDAGLFRGGSAEDFRPPCVAVVGLSNLVRHHAMVTIPGVWLRGKGLQVAVEMDHADGPVCAVDAAQ